MNSKETEAAWSEGREAYELAAGEHSTPYPPASVAHEVWSDGWQDGYDDEHETK